MTITSIFATAPPAKAATVEGNGFYLYGEGTVLTPRLRKWTSGAVGTPWGSETSLPSSTGSSSLNRFFIEAAPTRDEMIAVSQTPGGVVDCFRWDGATDTWSLEWSATPGITNGNAARQAIAYEQVSGNAMVLYSTNTGTTNEIAYRTWDGENWSGATNYDAVRTSGVMQNIVAKPRLGTDEIAVAWGDASLDLSANYWDGSSWVGEPGAAFETSLSVITAVTSLNSRSFDIAFEGTSGEALLCWGKDATADLYCATRTAGAGGSWSGATAHTAFVLEPSDFDMDAEPGSNLIGYANIADAGAGAGAEGAIWDGSAWGNRSNFDTTVNGVGVSTSNISGAWTQSGAQSRYVVTYDDSSALGTDWVVYNKNSPGWTVQTDNTTVPRPAGGSDRMHVVRRDPFDPAVLVTSVMDSAGVIFGDRIVFDGSTFTWTDVEPGTVALETTASAQFAWGADFAYNAYVPDDTLTADIVDADGTTVGSPSVALSVLASGTTCQTSTGTFGVSGEKIRVSNSTTTPGWSLSVAATSGATANWSSGAASYDFNDPSGSPAGCADGGGDADSLAGQLSVDPSGGTITPQSGCSNTGVTAGSSSAFNQGTVNSITLMSGSSSARLYCYWDLTGVALSQKIPTFQAAGSYSLNMTMTVVAS